MLDFETFRKQRLQQNQSLNNQGMTKAELPKPHQERSKLIQGMQGRGERFQDHRFANTVAPIKSQVKGELYRDHRLADGLLEIQGQGKKYQDHRLGPGVQSKPQNNSHVANMQKKAQVKKYQDHRIGKGFSGLRPSGKGQQYQDHRQGGIPGD